MNIEKKNKFQKKNILKIDKKNKFNIKIANQMKKTEKIPNGIIIKFFFTFDSFF